MSLRPFRNRYRTILAKCLFLILPTLLACFFLLSSANQFYSILNDQSIRQTAYVGVGMITGIWFYHFRFRFLPSFLLLLLALTIIYQGIDAISINEFDTFFRSIQFLVFAFLFTAGWLIGWGFSRIRYFSVILSALFLGGCILLISKQNQLFLSSGRADSTWQDYARLFGPILLYAVYLIFASVQIHNARRQKSWWPLAGRMLLFGLLAALLTAGIFFWQRQHIEQTLAEVGGGGREGTNSLLKRNKDNTFDLKDYTRLRGSLGRSNELLFAAHIDHFFPNSEIPNPLYLTAFYYSKFDTATETFERDSLLPDNDLFLPNPDRIPLFATRTDSSVLAYGLQEKYKTTVDIQVYKKKLSPATFVAPSTAFFVQPITVEKDFQHEFTSAYRAKSYVSALNSAYFVYNAADPQISAFQEQRFQVLRQVKNYTGVDSALMAYYTDMPDDPKFDRIRTLAAQLTQGKTTPVDKVLAIRDYFLSDDENGEPLFRYSDNPGIPDIPSASKLQYFLFENHQGYCAYYAGATLFLLRALGIPSRITVGFMTVDRSNKNKGWYWYYADQAHAWVQIYFPGFGWLDFDTTVGNEDARESPQPDGTPPMQPPKAHFAASGVITTIDTVSKTATLKTGRFMFHDREYRMERGQLLALDLTVAQVRKDSTYVSLSAIHTGDSATAVSYAAYFKQFQVNKHATPEVLLRQIKSPAPIDELYVNTPSAPELHPTPETTASTPSDSLWWIWLVGGALLLLIILYFSLPRIVLGIFSLQRRYATTNRAKASSGYRLIRFYLFQLGYSRGSDTMWQFARRIDQKFASQFSGFMENYLVLKYANRELTETKQQLTTAFPPQFIKQIRRGTPPKQRIKCFLNGWRTILFLRGAQ